MLRTFEQMKTARFRRDALITAGIGITLLLIVGLAFYDYYTPEWSSYQSEFRDLVTEKFGPERAATVQNGLQQVYVEKLGVTDRCVTCHLGIEWKGLENAPQPFRTHPKEILETHPIEQYGCTTCHGGQGFATDIEDAHGLIKDWEEPVLGKDLSKFYVISNRKALLQQNCNVCHRYESETKGAEFINMAKKLIADKGCRACHVINGRGGSVGPNLTYVGTKSPEQYTYERMKGLQTQFSWHVAHFKNPKEVVPETVMPNFGFSTMEAQALSTLVMSWRKVDLPIEYYPNNNVKDIPTPEEKAREEKMLKGPGAFFVQKNCFLCHSVSTLDVNAAAQIGPDLSIAVEDVQARFGRTLEDFLAKPTGTMEVVLSTMVQLSDEERKEAIEKLKHAYDLKLKERKKSAQK